MPLRAQVHTSLDDSQRKVALISALALALVLVVGPALKAQPRQQTTAQESAQAEQPIPFWQRATNDPVAAFTFGLLFFTGTLCALGWIQAGRLQATVAQMRVTEERQLRAYVIIDNLEVTGPKPTGRAPRSYILTIKNFGQTPAYDVDVRLVYEYGPLEESALPPLDLDSAPRNRTIVGPGGSLYVGCYPPATSIDVLNAVHAGTMDLYVRGVIRYGDAFGRQRTTRFCQRRARNGHVMEGCAEGNDAD